MEEHIKLSWIGSSGGGGTCGGVFWDGGRERSAGGVRGDEVGFYVEAATEEGGLDLGKLGGEGEELD